jgi:formate hydrogenlyase transcriptional activator
MTRRHQSPNEAPQDHTRFETLLAEISAAFISLPADRIDSEIDFAQHRICEFFNLDRSTLWELDEGEAEPLLLLTHFFQPPGSLPPAERMNTKDFFPWASQRALRGETVSISKMAELPPEAGGDRESFRLYGTKSTVVVPLSVGGGPVFGLLSFAVMREERSWPEETVTGFKLIAQVFANALARKRADQALRENEARLNLATEGGGAGLWILELDTQKVWVSQQTRELFHFAPDEEVFYKRFFEVIHPDDRERVNQEVQQALHSSETFLSDFRILVPDGNIRWIVARWRRYAKSTGEPERLMGISFDITDRKQTQLQLADSQALLSALVNSTSDLIWSVDSKRFGLLTFNRGLYEYFLKEIGIQIEAGMTPDDLLPTEEYAQKWYGFYRRALEEGSFTTEYQVYSGTRTLRLNINTVKRDGVVFGVSVFGQDITERKKAEESLQEAYQEIKGLKDRLETENIYLRREVCAENIYEHIIGHSEPLGRVLHRVDQVAPTDAIVLLTGETGTGKELIAEAIHHLSKRKDQLLVKVNCAALPAALVENELFGREKGAYTGALSRQIGRFELADHSTLFLDEITELPPDVQAKLLRVLQNGEFERLGGPKTIRVDVRVIAATNRDLATEVQRGAFRKDLYYRLNVFSIDVPPLRERPEDIPLLAQAFVKEFAEKMGKKIQTLSSKSMDALQRYHWPGNIRELRNVIEHAVIVSSGTTLNVQVPPGPGGASLKALTLEEAEYAHIMETLQSTGWRIKGPRGAAKLLGMKPSTLYAKMQRLGIPTQTEKDGGMT